MRTLETVLAEKMKNPNFRSEFEALEPEFAIIQAIINARKSKNITQLQLSKLTGITQADISKLETGNANPTIKMLQRLASGMDMNIKVEFVPKHPEA